MKKKFMGIGLAAMLVSTMIPMQTAFGADSVNSGQVLPMEADDESIEDYMDGGSSSGAGYTGPPEMASAGAGEEDVTGTFTDDNFRSAVREMLNLGEDDPIIRSACADVT